MLFDPFRQYKKETDPFILEGVFLWKTAIGLQGVDNLKVSDYLYNLAKSNINGDLNIDLVLDYLTEYYDNNGDEDRTREADFVSANIVKTLLDKEFSLSIEEYIKIHKGLFGNILSYAGTIRKSNIRKSEPICNGHSVYYGDAVTLKEDLEKAFQDEKEFSFSNLNEDEKIEHLASFIKTIWKLHVFGEGNTRTTSCLLIKYLFSLGYTSLNDTYYENSHYFRNTLVRATFRDKTTDSYLIDFLRNLILKEPHKFNDKKLHI